MDVRVGCLLIYTAVYFGLCIGVPRGQEGPPGPQGPIGLTGQPGRKGEKGERGEQGFPGEKGDKGVPGIQGLTGLTGFRGNKGDPGEPGRDGMPGPAGWPGLPGLEGEKGSIGQTGPSGPKGEKGECETKVSSKLETGPKGPKGEPGSDGNRGEKGETGTKGPPGPPGKEGAPGPKGSPGRKGDQGPKGPAGDQGKNGAPGEKGQKGDRGPAGINGTMGEMGPMGPPGKNGSKGDKGDKGEPGLRGPAGLNGTLGPQGSPGAIGAHGPPGMPGLPGVCSATCTIQLRLPDERTRSEGEVAPPLGSRKNPSSAICKYKIEGEKVEAPEPYWVTEDDQDFPVHCDRTTNMTCLILESLQSKGTEWFDETKIMVNVSKKAAWLSKSGFDLNTFNTIRKSRMNWFRAQSDHIVQDIRVYLKNVPFESIKLRMLNWNDILIDQNPSAVTPMHYHVQEQNTVMVGGEIWNYIDLVIIDDVKRLPIVDFYVENNSAEKLETFYLNVQLRKLCFG